MIIYECDKCKVTTYDEMEMLFGKHVCVSCKNRLEEYVADYFQPETKPLEKAGRDISDLIKTATETAYDLPPGSIDRDTRQQPIAEARQVAMCIARDITDWSYPYIAERFGKRDHTTVIHAERKVKESYNDCEVFAKMYDDLMGSLTY